MSRFDTSFDTYVVPAVERAFGVSVVLQRGSATSGTITALRDEPQPEVFPTEETFHTDVSPRIYRLPKATTIINGQTVEPKQGDRIIETVNGVERKYDVLPDGAFPGVEEDKTGLRWIVRTKRVR